jgi:hypothetical protein
MNAEKRKWEQVEENSGNQWKPQAIEKNGFKMSDKKEDNFREGYYIENKELPGKDGVFTVHIFQEAGLDNVLGEKFDVVGGKVLGDLLEKIPLGSYVGIRYVGRKLKKAYPAGQAWSQTNSFHMWEVFQDAGAIPYGKLSGKKEESSPIVGGPTKVEAEKKPFNEDGGLPF